MVDPSAIEASPSPLQYAGYRRCASSDGTMLYYCSRGSGPTLVIVNNFTQDPALWSRFGRLITDDYRVVVYDLRNQGLSGRGTPGRAHHARDLLAILDAIEAPTATLLGHSYGTQIAAECAIRFPERIEAAVLCSPVLHASGARRRARVLEAWREALVHGGAARLFDALWPLAASDGLVTAIDSGQGSRYALVRRAFIEAVDRDAMLVNFDGALGDQEVSLDLGAIACPTLLIVGDEDWMTPPRAVRELQREIPRSQVRTLDGIGHLPYVEAPMAVVAAVRDFLAGSRLPRQAVDVDDADHLDAP